MEHLANQLLLHTFNIVELDFSALTLTNLARSSLWSRKYTYSKWFYGKNPFVGIRINKPIGACVYRLYRVVYNGVEHTGPWRRYPKLFTYKLSHLTYGSLPVIMSWDSVSSFTLSAVLTLSSISGNFREPSCESPSSI